ncbi:glucokinase [Defluviimonas sp. 20V17]|nr:glucokinase [Allgaiera indica]KDB04918.1 glucokinase [Defluviimonas sp. 20V17]GHE05662.1 glucokinase [Allgaiera indica]
MSENALTAPVLVADIGGTNTRVALADGAVVRPESVRRFRNADYPGLEPLLAEFLAEAPLRCQGACIATAGPVRDGVARLTNLPWVMDGAALTRVTGCARVAILNDLQAQGHALDHLPAGALREIIPGAPVRAGTTPARLVVGVGTGFNAAVVHDLAGGRLVTASECGQASLPLHDEADLALARALGDAHGFAGVESVLSGRGLEALYRFIAAGQTRAAAEIMQGFEAGSDPRAEETARRFVRFLGAVTGDLALIHLPFGGIHLCGGVARAFAPHLVRLGYPAAFTDKGRFSGLVKEFAVKVIEDDYAALTGCAAYLAAAG